MKRYFILATIIMVVSSTAIVAQEHNHKHNSKMDLKKGSSSAENIIRDKEPIDLNAIDKNKDGKVFQDMMDWNVISDKPGKCPLCKMTLKEVKLEDAVKYLKENGFKVK